MRVGLEIEFVVPAGRTRRDLALALARPGERLRDVAQRADMPLGAPDEKPPRFWSGVFRGCRIESADGRWRWSVVQEMGVAVDADSPAHLGEARRWPWVGVLDPACADRVAEALEATWDPRAALERAAPLLGWRVHGPESGAPFALALHQACAEILQLGRSVDPWVAVGEGGRVAAVASFEQLGRERVAEVVTAPLPLGAVGRSIREVYAAVAAVGAQIGRESGTHVHFDGAPFRSPAALARVLNVLDAWREPTWTLLGWPGSRLTGPIGPPVVYLANRCAENGASWDELRSRLADYGVTKFCDLNVANLVDEHPRKPTFELRILPVDAEPSLMVRRTQLSIEIVLGALRATGPIAHPGRQPATRAAAREMLGHVGIDPSAWTDLLALLPDHRPLSARAPFRPARLPQDASGREPARPGARHRGRARDAPPIGATRGEATARARPGTGRASRNRAADGRLSLGPRARPGVDPGGRRRRPGPRAPDLGLCDGGGAQDPGRLRAAGRRRLAAGRPDPGRRPGFPGPCAPRASRLREEARGAAAGARAPLPGPRARRRRAAAGGRPLRRAYPDARTPAATSAATSTAMSDSPAMKPDATARL